MKISTLPTGEEYIMLGRNQMAIVTLKHMPHPLRGLVLAPEGRELNAHDRSVPEVPR